MYLFANAVLAPSPSSEFGNSAPGPRSHANAVGVAAFPGARRNVTHTAAADVGGVSTSPLEFPPPSSSAPVRSNASPLVSTRPAAFAGVVDAVVVATRGDEDAFDRDRDSDVRLPRRWRILRATLAWVPTCRPRRPGRACGRLSRARRLGEARSARRHQRVCGDAPGLAGPSGVHGGDVDGREGVLEAEHDGHFAGSVAVVLGDEAEDADGEGALAVAAGEDGGELRLRDANVRVGGERGGVVLVPRAGVERAVDAAGAVRGEDATRAGWGGVRVGGGGGVRARGVVAGRDGIDARVRGERGEDGGASVHANRREGVLGGTVHVGADAKVPPGEVAAVRAADAAGAHAPERRARRGAVVDARHARTRRGVPFRGIAHRMAPRHVRGRVQILLERRRRPEDQQREERRARQGDAAAHGGERAPRTGPTGGGADVTAPFLMSATTPAPASVNVVSSEGTVSSVDRTPGRAASNPRRVGPRVRTTRTSATSRAMVTPTKTKSACVNQVRGGPAVLNTRSRGHPRRV